MTEKEKMLAGEVYSAVDPELIEELMATREVLYEYNFLRPSETQRMKEILKGLLGHVADDDFRFSQAYGESVVEDGDEPVNFQLDLPFGVKPESVILKVEYGNGLRKTFTLGKRDIKTTGNIFPAVLPIEDRKVTLTIDGLVMLEDTLGPVEPAPELAVSLVATSKRADKEGHFFFEVVFSNPGRKAVSIPIRVGGKRVVCGKKEVTIPAGGKTKVQGYSTDVTVREKRAIRIEYDGKVTDRIINVVPIVG